MTRRIVRSCGMVVLFLLALYGVGALAHAGSYEVVVSSLLPGEDSEEIGPAATGTVTIINKTKVCIESELDHMDSTEVKIRPKQKAVYKGIPQGQHNIEVSECNHAWEREKNIKLKKEFTWVVK